MSGKTKSQIGDWLKANPGSPLGIRMSDEAFKQMLERLRSGDVQGGPTLEPGALQQARNQRYRGDPLINPPGRKKPAGRSMINMVGEQSGQLIVHEYEGRFVSGGTAGKPLYEHFWICECSCGSKVSVSTLNLRQHRTKRCAECRRGPRR